MPSPGDKDYQSSSAAPYLDRFSLPQVALSTGDQGRYYSFDWGNAHVVVLDSNAPLQESTTSATSMYTWLKSDLAQSS